jgi:CRISPR/Cas system Type II protein with McrA/HNH and RuvC-like nuclease domain
MANLPAFPKPSQLEGHVTLTRKQKRVVTLELYYEQHGICACGCGYAMSLTFGLFDTVELDHIEPQPMGHKKNDARSNLRAVRHCCNSAKGSRRDYDGGAEGKR